MVSHSKATRSPGGATIDCGERMNVTPDVFGKSIQNRKIENHNKLIQYGVIEIITATVILADIRLGFAYKFKGKHGTSSMRECNRFSTSCLFLNSKTNV